MFFVLWAYIPPIEKSAGFAGLRVCGVSFPIARQSQRAARGGFLPPLNRQGSTQNTIWAATKHPGASSISHILRVSIRIKRLRNGQNLHTMALKPMALHRGELSHIPSSSEATYNLHGWFHL